MLCIGDWMLTAYGNAVENWTKAGETMASISKEPNGRRTIQFCGADGKRRSIRLGKVSQKTAEAVKVRIEHLAAAAETRHALDGETARWVARLGDDLAGKLARAGLIPERESATLGDFLQTYIESRIDVKPASRVILRHVKRNLIDFLGAGRKLRSITSADAEDFRLHLVGEGLAASTIAKRLQRARQMFAAMKRRKLIEENPFAEVKHHEGNPAERQRFIDRDQTAKLLDAAPGWIWRSIIALCRYGGLRCPSEVLSLRWCDVDWERSRLRVVSPKTEHHAGKASRVVPIFPELRPYLEEAWDAAEEGQEHVVPTRYRDAAQGPEGWRNCNLRTQFERIIRRAGLEPWPRLFHNLRASCETELAQRHPVHVVTAWLGNTPRVALRHYLQVTESDFAIAVQNPVQATHDSAQTVQNPVQPTAATTRQETTEPQGTLGVRFDVAGCGENRPESLVVRAEPSSKFQKRQAETRRLSRISQPRGGVRSRSPRVMQLESLICHA